MAQNEKHRLNSWKEIAAYLDVETRTVMRWEKERGLPVHRIPGGLRQPVFAYQAELDAWLNGQPQTLREEDMRQPVPTRAGAGDVEYRKAGSASRKQALWLSSALLVFVMAAWFLGRSLGSPAQPALATLVGDTLTVSDARGRELWRHTFPP